MREIKFRAWDKRENAMRDGDATGDGKALSINRQIVSLVERDFILMQFTGLHDKNGKEVFESDIVEITDTFHTYPVAIKWDVKRARWSFDVREPECYGDLDEWTNMEIIGNIYSNPELLT